MLSQLAAYLNMDMFIRLVVLEDPSWSGMAVWLRAIAAKYPRNRRFKYAQPHQVNGPPLVSAILLFLDEIDACLEKRKLGDSVGFTGN